MIKNPPLIYLMKTRVKKMIDKYLYKLFGTLDNLIYKMGRLFDEGHKIIGNLFKKRKRKKSN